MRLRGISNPFRWLANNPWIIILAFLASILSYFTGFRTYMEQCLSSAGIESRLVIDTVTFAVSLLALVVLLSIVGYFIERRYRKRLRIYTGSVESVLWQDASGERISEFQRLRSDAENSTLVMGIGLTFFSRDLSYLETLLARGLIVRILMIDPDIICQARRARKRNHVHSITIESGLFNDYFVRQGYDTDIRTSFNTLKGFVLKRKKIKNKRGQVSFKKYPYFIPMNVTIIDESNKNGRGRMLLEWCLPFSDWRMSSRLSRSEHREFFEVVNKKMEELWNRSEMVVDDREEETMIKVK